jgi:hypothetical protein
VGVFAERVLIGIDQAGCVLNLVDFQKPNVEFGLKVAA